MCKALKGEAIVLLLRVLNNTADESLRLALWVKIDEKKEHHPFYHLGKVCGPMILLKSASIKDYKNSH
jgi:hypothetical protein